MEPVKNNMYQGSFRRKQALGNPVESVAFRYLPVMKGNFIRRLEKWLNIIYDLATRR